MSTHPTRIVPFIPLTYTSEEQSKIFDYFKELKMDYIKNFLAQKNLHRTGTKDQLIDEIKEHVVQNRIHFSDLVNFLDLITPFGKQHVFLYNGNEHEVNNWRRPAYVRHSLEENNRLQFLSQKLPLILPSDLSLSSIEYHPGRDLKILAVQRRNFIERREDLDPPRIGEDIELHAYKHQVLRGLIIFYWDLISNQARLQITQLPSRGNYEDVETAFGQLIHPWLFLNSFTKLNLRPSITQLRILEAEMPEARSLDISLVSLGGRKISVKSPTSQDSTSGEEIVDEAVEHIRDIVVGHLGNFYWLPNTVNSRPGNILEDEVHTIIVGNKGRINFMTPNKKEDFEYVLSRVRSMC
jgi:hypothetical protein